MKRLTTNQMLKVEGGCKCYAGSFPTLGTKGAGRVFAHLIHVIFH